MSHSSLIKHIVLVGQALPLKMSAAILSSQLAGYGVKITALELVDDEDEEFAALESTGPEFMALCDMLNVPARQLLTTCQATFSLGHQYQRDEYQWFVPYGHYGLQAQDGEFMQGIFRLQQQYPELTLDSVCIAAQAARQNRFAIAPDNRPDLQDALVFSVNWDARQYAEQLTQIALQRGARFIQADRIEVERDRQQHISAVKLDNQDRLVADFWIDCSGQQVVLATNYQSVKNTGYAYAANCIVECWTECQESPPQPYSRFEHCPWGWLKVSSIPGRCYYQLEYNSQQVSQEQVEQWLIGVLPTPPAHIEHRESPSSALANAWQANCLIIGNAAVNWGQQLYSESFFIHAALTQFLDLYPSLSNLDIGAQCFNRYWQQFVDEAAEYAQCHYWLGSRNGTDGQAPDDALFRQRLELFLRCGRMPPAETDAVSDQRWYGLLAGLGKVPELTSLYLSNLSNAQLEQSLQQITGSIEKLVAGMPTYQDFYQPFYQAVKNEHD